MQELGSKTVHIYIYILTFFLSLGHSKISSKCTKAGDDLSGCYPTLVVGKDLLEHFHKVKEQNTTKINQLFILCENFWLRQANFISMA